MLREAERLAKEDLGCQGPSTSLEVPDRRSHFTVLDGLFRSGCLRVRLPVSEPERCIEAVLVNAADGMMGGGRPPQAVRWGTGSCAAATAQACKKLYRATDDTPQVPIIFNAEVGTNAERLPQETIALDHARFDGDLRVLLAVRATFTGVESIVMGRAPMGERVGQVNLRDGWRIWHGSCLIYADALNLSGDASKLLIRPSITQDCMAFASLMQASPYAESARKIVRTLPTNDNCIAGASAWSGLLAVRFVAGGSASLRHGIVRVLNALLGILALQLVGSGRRNDSYRPYFRSLTA